MFTPRRQSMLTPVANSSGRPRTPVSSRMASGKRRTSLLSSLYGAGKRTAASGRVGSSSLMQSSFVLEESANHVVEVCETPLPVAVTEILTLSEETPDVSVCMSPNGWAWMVHGRRLVVWRYNKSGGSKFSGVNCRELALPPSDLAHSAKLVNVFAANEAQTPSCLAVSPGGIIRYWPSVAHEGLSYEVSADLQGQECYSLTDLQPLGSILTTTTSSVVLVQLENAAGQHSIACRQLNTPHGLLGGIGRRMSSFLWSSLGSSSGSSESRMVQVLSWPGSGRDDLLEMQVLVLTSQALHKWQLQGQPNAGGCVEKLVYSCDVDTMAKQAFAKNMWAVEATDPSWIRIFVLDMQLHDDALILLISATNQNVDQNVHYALGSITVTDPTSVAAPDRFEQFICLNITTPFTEASHGLHADHALGSVFRLLCAFQTAFVFNDSAVYCVSLEAAGSRGPGPDEHDKLEFTSAKNVILGMGMSAEQKPLFFTTSDGIVMVSPTDLAAANITAATMDRSSLNLTSLNESQNAVSGVKLSDTLNLSISQTGLDNLTMSESKKDQLKAAFLLYCKGEADQSIDIIDQCFPADKVGAGSAGDSPLLDRLVVSMSNDLIDDLPASDPRWLESLPASEAAGVGSSKSLLIAHQLEDKKLALTVFIGFLNKVALWNRLSEVFVRDVIMATWWVIGEHMEKTTAAITLRSLHHEHQALVDRAIVQALALRGDASPSLSNLTPQDLFYCKISKVEDIVDGFLQVENEELNGKLPQVVVRTVSDVNKILLGLFKEVLHTRRSFKEEMSPGCRDAAHLEYLPWTSNPGPKGLRTLLIRQYHVTLDKAVPIADSVMRAALWQQLVQLCDLVLEGFRCQLDSISNEHRKSAVVLKQYEKERSALITPFVGHGPDLLEDAASLAEKYLEFDVLVKICEQSHDQQRLEKYMDQFGEYNFSDYVFQWHVKQGKQSQLLSQNYSAHRRQQFNNFLEGHTNFSWVHFLQHGPYEQAAAVLSQLAHQEVAQVQKRKTYLSLAKLATLMSDDALDGNETSLTALDNELAVVVTQEQLPPCVLQRFGFDVKKMKVLSPRQMIELYTGEANEQANEANFKKALDLLQFLPLTSTGGSADELLQDREELRLQIWSRAILRDDWTHLDPSDPVAAVQETLFFRLAALCHRQELDLRSELPPPTSLFQSPDLQQLQHHSTFRFLIQTGYEHILRQCAA